MYGSAPELRTLLAGVADDDPSTPAVWDDTALTPHLGTAAAEVDTTLAGRYPVPIDPPPPLLVTIALAIAAWHATLSYRRATALDDTDPVALRYRWATALLGRIATGAADLPGVDDTPTTGGGRAVVVQPYAGQLFDQATFGLGIQGGRRGHLR